MKRLILAAVVMLVLAAPAAALPPDPPITPLEPAEGASLPVNADGIVVRFTCPPYTTVEDPLFGPIAGLISDYGAAISRAPDVGADGRLATRDGLGSAFESSPGSCQSTLGSGGFPKPQTTPGAWYWQAWRNCSGCASGFETSPVRSFTLTAGGTITLGVPRKAYVGYPIVAAVKVESPSSPAQVTIERRSGSTWVAVGEVALNEEDAFIKLPRGKVELRATARFGAESLSSPARTVTVAKPLEWQTSRRDDGRYRDAKRPSVRFAVTGGGRTLSGFRADVPTICSSTTSPTGTEPGISTVTLPKVKLAPDGGFAVEGTYKSIKVRFSGRLHGRRLTGARAAIRTSACTGSIAVEARRR